MFGWEVVLAENTEGFVTTTYETCDPPVQAFVGEIMPILMSLYLFYLHFALR